MTTPRPSLVRGAALALVLSASVLVACGDDGDADGGAAAAADPSNGACAGTDLEFENLVTGVRGTATTALATRDAQGSQYTAHVADFDLAEADVAGWRPEVPDGGNVITFQLTVFIDEDSPTPAAVEPGTTIGGGELRLDTLTFLVRHFDIDQDWSETVMADGVGGEMTITSVGDTFCFEVDYQDLEKRASGTVEAHVFREGF